TQKLANIAAKGARVSLIYDNGGALGALQFANYTTALIQAADGEFLVSQFVAGAKVTITFPQKGASAEFPNPAGGLVSPFTRFLWTFE
ncbi:hypothetical protein DXG03_006285, partial [Asterophora parasitica]